MMDAEWTLLIKIRQDYLLEDTLLDVLLMPVGYCQA